MAQGIAHADLINTVSPSYAREIVTPGMGMGLAPLLEERQDRLFGVVNGIDYEQWNPATDPHIPHRFDGIRLDRRTANKTVLQQQARLPVRSEIPLIGMVTRLDEVKGMGLMEPVLEWLLAQEAQFILLGAGDSQYHEMFEQIQDRFPHRMRAFLKLDEVMAHRIYAGADMLLMPSGVEPCGREQMIAMRYGCVPVVRATGGLADTVSDNTAKRGRGTGFTFTDYSPEACQDALQRALETYTKKPSWRSIQQRGLATDSSWLASAEKYIKLYRQAVEVHGT